MMLKYFRIKYLFLGLKDSHRKKIQAGNCAKEWQLNQRKPQEVKINSYKLSKKNNGKKRKG